MRFRRLKLSGFKPSSSKAAQWPQVIDPNSTSFTLASGLPIRKPPSGVWTTMLLQSPLLGAGTGVAVVPETLAVAVLPLVSALHALLARIALAARRREKDFMSANAP